MACFDLSKAFSRECFEIIIQSLAEALFIVDTKGIIRYCNKAMETLTGVPFDKLIGKHCRDVMVCSCTSMEQCELFRTGSFNNIECQVPHAHGETAFVLKNGRKLYTDEGKVVGAVETIRNITTLKKIEDRVSVLEATLKERYRYHNLLGKSKAMRDIFELIELAADSHSTILISGETGTGKELVATAIHEKSTRKEGPLIKVNCSALPENLLESELFGHVKGAFTTAIKDKIGRFERANGGTLFLDEIGEISPLIQLKLLRFLQEREFERVGESITRKADTRIIAATHRDLRAMTQNGQFREDLYYRLKIFPIHLPPLRERKEDIGLLAAYFIDKFNRETGKSITGLSRDAALVLIYYSWPGNIRELENAIEHAFVTCRRSDITIFDLPLEIRQAQSQSAPSAMSSVSAKKDNEISRSELISLLDHYHWNKAEVSHHLGIDRTTLWRRMKKWGIPLRKK
ncbi:MAG: sigma-54 interaction domain-containing protein [bacterium]